MDIVRRSSRLRTVKATYTPNKATTNSRRKSTVAKDSNTTHKVDYKLDKAKAIKKQRDATVRPHVDIKFAEGNIVLTFSSAAFHEFKAVTINYLNSKNLSIQSRATTDVQNAVVSESVSVCDNGMKLFVLNFYNSTCKLLLNGNRIHIINFINNFLIHILTILDRNPKFDEINKAIRDCCNVYLAQNDHHQDNKHNTGTVPDNFQGNTLTSGYSSTEIPTVSSLSPQFTTKKPTQKGSLAVCTNSFPICPICDKACDNEPTSVACDLCNSWLHYTCEGLKPEQIDEIEQSDSPYKCNLCLTQVQMINSKLGDTTYNDKDDTNISNKRLSGVSKACNSEINSSENKLRLDSTVSDPSVPITTSKSTPLIISSEIKHLQSVVDQKDKTIRTRDNKILKLESEITQLKKQLATNRSYAITIEEKNKDLQQSLLISNQRIQQLESKNNNSNPSNVEHDTSDSSDIKEIKVWFLEQKLRQLELDVHRNNTEMLIMKNSLATQNLQRPYTKTRRGRRKRPTSNANDETGRQTFHLSQPNLDTSDLSTEDFLDKPSPLKIRKMNSSHNQHLTTTNTRHAQPHHNNTTLLRVPMNINPNTHNTTTVNFQTCHNNTKVRSAETITIPNAQDNRLCYPMSPPNQIRNS